MDSRVIKSVDEMNSVAADIVRDIQASQVLLLYGELGAGKTTFVQGLAKALGITDPVTSPTFVIASEYSVPPDKGGGGVLTLAHVDLYRLDETTAPSDPAVRDVLGRAVDPGRLTVIEWADRLGETSVSGARKISFIHGDEPTERVVTIS